MDEKKSGGQPGCIANVTAFVGEDLVPSLVDIWLRDGKIVSLEPPRMRPSEPDDYASGEGFLDGTGMLAFPGMVDCHDHLRNLTPGLSLSEGVRLDDFLKVMWATQAEMGPTEYRLGALLGSIQRLKTGITTVADHCYTYHEAGLDEASIAGYEASGIRWVYARGIMTRPYRTGLRAMGVGRAPDPRPGGERVGGPPEVVRRTCQSPSGDTSRVCRGEKARRRDRLRPLLARRRDGRGDRRVESRRR